MKRILTIQDISCLGKCSMTVALPVISAMGVECAILPTALLSTHTMYPGWRKTDLHDQMLSIADHWEELGIRFDAIYTGYLGNSGLVSAAERIIDRFRRPGCPVFVDPVMGDYGKQYAGLKEDYILANRELCGFADIIVPNITEACLMTGLPYRTDYDDRYIRELLEALAALGAKTCVLTGVRQPADQIGVMGLHSDTREFFSCFVPRVPFSCHGTGDIFASVSIAALTKGYSLKDSFRIAAGYTAETIRVTHINGKEDASGADFEETIPFLLRLLSPSEDII